MSHKISASASQRRVERKRHKAKRTEDQGMYYVTMYKHVLTGANKREDGEDGNLRRSQDTSYPMIWLRTSLQDSSDLPHQIQGAFLTICHSLYFRPLHSSVWPQTKRLHMYGTLSAKALSCILMDSECAFDSSLDFKGFVTGQSIARNPTLWWCKRILPFPLWWSALRDQLELAQRLVTFPIASCL